MADSDKVFAGSIPKFYDTLMVPLIFEVYAANMAEVIAASSPDSVLETAAGSGVVTRSLAQKLKPDARYVVTDLNQPMLDYAATRPIAVSNGGRRTRSIYRSELPRSTSFAASSARCSSPTGWQATPRRVAC